MRLEYDNIFDAIVNSFRGKSKEIVKEIVEKIKKKEKFRTKDLKKKYGTMSIKLLKYLEKVGLIEKKKIYWIYSPKLKEKLKNYIKQLEELES